MQGLSDVKIKADNNVFGASVNVVLSLKFDNFWGIFPDYPVNQIQPVCKDCQMIKFRQ